MTNRYAVRPPKVERYVRDPRKPKRVLANESSIDGMGLFADEDIWSGEFVIAYEGPVSDRNSPYLMQIVLTTGERFGIEASGMARFINHSLDANLEMGDVDTDYGFYAKRFISKGEELTWNYQDGLR